MLTRGKSVARLVHGNDTSLINENVPKRDNSGTAKMLRKKYGLKAGRSLCKFVRDHDPICPYPAGGLFGKTTRAWRSDVVEKSKAREGIKAMGEPWDPSR